MACDMSPSGEALAFGGSGGYVHLWAFNQEPHVNQYHQPLEVPGPPMPSVSLGEEGSFAAVPQYFTKEVGFPPACGSS